MTILRVYDPPECDKHGVPLDWKRCRTCNSPQSGYGVGASWVKPCPTCDGHGSLEAAALHHLTFRYEHGRLQGKPFRERCADCGHPMSEGTWERIGEYDGLVGWPSHESSLLTAEDELRDGRDPESMMNCHFSPCDEVCRHGGPTRDVVSKDVPLVIEALWRPVDVRTLGWPHDLRPEKLAVLCLRCFAERNL